MYYFQKDFQFIDNSSDKSEQLRLYFCRNIQAIKVYQKIILILVSFTAVVCGEERCVATLKKAVKETIYYY